MEASMVTYTPLEASSYDVTNAMTYEDVGVYSPGYTDTYACTDAAYRLAYASEQASSPELIQPAVTNRMSQIGVPHVQAMCQPASQMCQVPPPQKDVAYDSVLAWLNQQSCGGIKRKRRITRPQRIAANVRERRRMTHLNVAFEELRETIPKFPNEKKLSRIQTLKLAIDYISMMSNIIYGNDMSSPLSQACHQFSYPSNTDSGDSWTC